MSLGRVLLDSAVFIYALAAEHPYRGPCRALVMALRADAYTGESSVLAAQELMHQRLRRTGARGQSAAAARDLALFCTLHDLTVEDLVLGAELFAGGDGLDAADACHAATAINRDIPVIVSPDAAFDAVPALDRLDPGDAADRL